MKEKQMSEMSPLGKVLLRLLRGACLGAAGLLLGFLCLAVWQKTSGVGIEGLARQDVTFMGILAAMAFGAVWLARAIQREMDNPGS
jgi:hypothetical protein